jgi:hypothetical protein
MDFSGFLIILQMRSTKKIENRSYTGSYQSHGTMQSAKYSPFFREISAGKKDNKTGIIAIASVL